MAEADFVKMVRGTLGTQVNAARGDLYLLQPPKKHVESCRAHL